MKPTCKIFLWLVLAVLTGLAACKKESLETSVEGKVVDNTTQAPITGAKVFLYGGDVSNSSWGSGSYRGDTLEITTPDANGNYSFFFTAQKGWTYSIGAVITDDKIKKLYDEIIMPIGIDKYKKNFVNIGFTPIAWLKIFVKNTEPFDNHDYISINEPFFGGVGGGPFWGMYVDTFAFGTVYGNQKNDFIGYWVEKDSVKKRYTKPIFCQSFDTTIYYLNY